MLKILAIKLVFILSQAKASGLEAGFKACQGNCHKSSIEGLRIPINVIGEDERENEDDPAFNGVGMVYSKSEGLQWRKNMRAHPGTAEVFYSKDTLLTSAHMFYDDKGSLKAKSIQDFLFSLNGQSYEIERATFGTTNPEKEPGKDFALIKLKKSVQANVLTYRPDGVVRRDFKLVAYHADKRGLQRSTGRFLSRQFTEKNLLAHNFDSNAQASGGAIVTPHPDGYSIDALHVGNIDNQTNYAVRISGNPYFTEKLNEFLSVSK